MRPRHSMILLLALIHDCNSSTASTICYITCVEITVVPNTGDGPNASESTGVSDALGTCSNHNGKSNMVLDMHMNGQIWLHKAMQNRNKVVENVKNASNYIMENVTPNMGIAFLALTIQTIYQLKFPTPTTTREGKMVRKINGIAAALLLYGLVIPKSAGGRIALLVGVLLASLVAIIISFTN